MFDKGLYDSFEESSDNNTESKGLSDKQKNLTFNRQNLEIDLQLPLNPLICLDIGRLSH